MKVCIIQPAYSTDFSKSDSYFEEQLRLIDACDESMDMIVLPENCDIPCLASTKEQSEEASVRFNKRLLDKVAETAKRCHAMVFVSARSTEEGGLRNTTYAFNREGEIVGKYFKQHLTPGETAKLHLDSEYSFEFSEPTVLEMEIEFDLWYTKDGEVVSIHDSTLDRVSNGTGKVWEYTLDELRTLDFGAKCGEAFRGMRIPTFEDILKKFACHCVMNIHLKTEGEKPEYLEKVVKLIEKYDCEKYVYFMTGEDELLERLQREYPHILRCCGGGKGRWQIVERAVKFGCTKLQFVKGYFNQEMVDRAHENGIICNVFWSDDTEETQRYLDMGIDVILTNDYNAIAQVVAKKDKYVTYR